MAPATRETVLPASRVAARLRTSDDGEYFVPFGCHQLRRLTLEVQPHERLGVRGPDVEVPRGIVHGDAVDLGDCRVGIARLDRGQHARHLVQAGQLRVDLSGDEVALA